MSYKLPPLPAGIAPGSGYWNDWYEKLRNLVNSIADGLAHNLLSGLQGGTSGEYYHLTSAETTKVTNAEQTTNKNSASGYAGLNSVSRVTKGMDTTDDLIIDLATTGLVLKDTAGTSHYWRITVTTLGTLTVTDLGTTKP